jgi:hypothetical protein
VGLLVHLVLHDDNPLYLKLAMEAKARRQSTRWARPDQMIAGMQATSMMSKQSRCWQQKIVPIPTREIFQAKTSPTMTPTTSVEMDWITLKENVGEGCSK